MVCRIFVVGEPGFPRLPRLGGCPNTLNGATGFRRRRYKLVWG